MNRSDEHIAFEELAAGHALSALEPEEEELFLRHVATCVRCQRDVEEHRATLAHLAFAPDAAEPPPELLGRIRAGVATSGRATSSPQTSQPQLDAPADELAAARARRQVRWGGVAQWTAVAAAAALVISLGTWNAALRSDREQSEARSERLAAVVRDVGQPGTLRVPLTGQDGQVVAVAMVDRSSMSLVVDGLAPNEDDTTYVLWAQDSTGQVRPVTTFDVSGQDLDVVAGGPVGDGMDGVTVLLVSHEQGEVAPPAPAGPVLATGQA